LVLAKDKVTQ